MTAIQAGQTRFVSTHSRPKAAGISILLNTS